MAGIVEVLRKRKFHRQNPLELETPKPNVFVAKRPSDLGLDILTIQGWSHPDRISEDRNGMLFTSFMLSVGS